MSINGENQTPMTHNTSTDSNPVWCSNTEVIYSSYHGNGDIYKTDGTTETPILTSLPSLNFWDCTLSGKMLYSKFTVDGEIEIFRINLEGSDEARLTHSRGRDDQSSFRIH